MLLYWVLWHLSYKIKQSQNENFVEIDKDNIYRCNVKIIGNWAEMLQNITSM